MSIDQFFFTYLVVYLIVSALLALVPAYIAEQKGRSYAAFWWLSFLTTIVVGLIAVLAMPALSPEERAKSQGRLDRVVPDLLKCPYCAEYIKSEAKICKHCGQSVEASFAAALETSKQNYELKRQAAAFEAAARTEREQLRLEEMRAKRRALVRSKKLYVSVAGVVALIVSAVFAVQLINDLAARNAAAEAGAEAQNASNAAKSKAELLSSLEPEIISSFGDCSIPESPTVGWPQDGDVYFQQTINPEFEGKMLAFSIITIDDLSTQFLSKASCVLNDLSGTSNYSPDQVRALLEQGGKDLAAFRDVFKISFSTSPGPKIPYSEVTIIAR